MLKLPGKVAMKRLEIRTEEGWLITIEKGAGLNVWFYTDEQFCDYVKRVEIDSFVIRKKVREYFKQKGIKTKLFPKK